MMDCEVDSFAVSAYDTHADDRYYDITRYAAFDGNKLRFALRAIRFAAKFNTIVIGHINLAGVGVVIKKIYPQKRILLITHGIDVWGDLNNTKQNLLSVVDGILSVSNFTKSVLINKHSVASTKVNLFPNTIDPFFPIPEDLSRNNSLKERYKIKTDDFVLFTLSRLSNTEAFKGYDNVIKAVAILKRTYPNIKYVLAGKSDNNEQTRIEQLIKDYGVGENVILTGYLQESELVAHYQMADTYIMPSKKEGFGIVFIEALVCGTPVIAGNADGSIDAVQDGATGTLVTPDSVEEIVDAIKKHISVKEQVDEHSRAALKEKTLESFSFGKYKQRLKVILDL